MDREQRQATLILQGWRAVELKRSALTTWGISHPEMGTIHENAWHKDHGPSLAPLVSTTYVIYQQEPHRECSFDSIPDLCFERLWEAVKTGVFRGS